MNVQEMHVVETAAITRNPKHAAKMQWSLGMHAVVKLVTAPNLTCVATQMCCKSEAQPACVVVYTMFICTAKEKNVATMTRFTV